MVQHIEVSEKNNKKLMVNLENTNKTAKKPTPKFFPRLTRNSLPVTILISPFNVLNPKSFL